MGAELLPWVLTSGWASGINAYAVVLLMGVFGRLGVDAVPSALQRTDVLVVAAVLFVVELVADKVPYLDSAWDAVHTLVRPVVGAAIAALLAGDAGSMEQAVMAATGGVSALASHLVKAGLRAAVNTSPEPASNIVVSSGEDLTVAGVVSLAVLNPWVAAAIALTLLVVGAVLVAVLWRRIRRVRRRWRDWRGRRWDDAPRSPAA
ncbi:MAG: DUF4126 domain-containing protein [Angustibacter sp.]